MIKDLCFEIIQACPNNCLFCSSRSDICKTTMISFEDFKRTIEYLNDKFGIVELSLSGGEPFLHPDLFKMVELCTNLGIKTVIFTSGIKRRRPFSQEEKTYLERDRDKRIKDILDNEGEDSVLIKRVDSLYCSLLNQMSFLI